MELIFYCLDDCLEESNFTVTLQPMVIYSTNSVSPACLRLIAEYSVELEAFSQILLDDQMVSVPKRLIVALDCCVNHQPAQIEWLFVVSFSPGNCRSVNQLKTNYCKASSLHKN